MSTNELFAAYQAGPSQETLLGLLRGVQGFVYNLCYQMLRHHQDAEDASQRVFLRVLEVLPRVQNVEHLKSLLARISFQVALNAAQARATRTNHERSKATMTRSDIPESPQELHALHRAIAALEPGLAGFVVDRYFEGKPLEQIAQDRGCSIAGVWKRLEKAKELLRQSLVRTGFGAMAEGLGSNLEAMTFATPSKDLITPAIATEAQAVAKAAADLVSAGALGAAGVGVFSGRAVALGLFSLLVGASGGGILVALSGSAGDASPPAIVREEGRRPKPGLAPLLKESTGAIPPTLAIAPTSDLQDRLRGFRDRVAGPKKMFLAAQARRRELEDEGAPVGSEGARLLTLRERSKQTVEALFAREWKELHEAVGNDSASFVVVLLEPESSEVCSELLGLWSYGPPHRSIPGRNRLPPALSQALDILVSSGSAEQKLAVFDAVQKPVGDPWLEMVCARFLGEPDPRLKENALWILGDNKVLSRYLDLLRASWKDTPQWSVREKAFETLRRQGTREARDLFWECAREALERSAGQPTGFVTKWHFVFNEPPRPDEEDQYAALVAQALRGTFDVDHFSVFRDLLTGTLNLPLPRAVRILEEARATLHPTLGNAVGRVTEQIRGGESRWTVLLQHFDAALPSKENR